MEPTPESSPVAPSLQLLKQQLLASAFTRFRANAVTGTGFALLDDLLPQRGWAAGVSELIFDHPASQEISLLLPAICSLQAQGRWAAFVSPPAIPYAPSLQAHGVDLAKLVVVQKQQAADAAWACEQLLQSHTCGLVLAWLSPRNPQVVRRLQLLAKEQGSLLFLCRPLSALRQSSVAQARLELQPQTDALDLVIHKLQGEIRRPKLSVVFSERVSGGA